jgi:hypothetical protein
MNNHPDGPADGSPNRFISFEEMAPEEAERMRDMIARAEKAPEPASVRARRERNELQPVQYAVTDERLPEGAVAAVVRDPSATLARLVVLSRNAGDVALYLADATLDQDEKAVPNPPARRLVFVTADRRLVIQKGRGTEIGTLDVTLPASPGRELTAPLVQAADRGRTIQVAGIGPVMLPEG